jgi:hypothetical protein
MADVTSSRPVGAAFDRANGDTNTGGNGFVDKLRSGATTQLNNQKDRATDGLGSMVQAVRNSTQQLREQNHDTIAGYVEQAADQIDKLSRTLRDKDIGQLMGEVQRFSKRQPAAFIGGAFALGLIAARFFKSSAERDSGTEWSSSSNAGREYRGYPQSVGNMAYSAHDVSRTRDYGSSSGTGREAGAPLPTGPGSESVVSDSRSGRSTGAGGARPRRGTQTERS